MSDFCEQYLDIVNASINFVRLKFAPSYRFTAFAGSYSVVLNEEQLCYLKMKYIGWAKFNLSQVTPLSSPKSIALTTWPRLASKNDVEEKIFGFVVSVLRKTEVPLTFRQLNSKLCHVFFERDILFQSLFSKRKARFIK